MSSTQLYAGHPHVHAPNDPNDSIHDKLRKIPPPSPQQGPLGLPQSPVSLTSSPLRARSHSRGASVGTATSIASDVITEEGDEKVANKDQLQVPSPTTSPR
ncbi:uncharacterized protein L969DRAFT_91064, partial [Mixia osmundae IAM 14324]